MSYVVRKVGFALLTALFAAAALAPLASVQTASAEPASHSLSTYRIVAAGEGPGDCNDIRKCDIIYYYVNPFVNFLAALVGVAVVASIIIGGIQYSSSGGDPSKASAAKNRIRNAIIALVAFILLWAMLNFLIPGGLA